MTYEQILNDIAEEAFEKRLHGSGGLYQIGRIPNIENLDYDYVIKELDEIMVTLESNFEMGEIFYDDF